MDIYGYEVNVSCKTKFTYFLDAEIKQNILSN